MKYPKEIWCRNCGEITPHRPKMSAVLAGNLVCNQCNAENKFGTMNKPDQWVVVKMDNGNPDELLYKVFASWIGGYLDGDYWRLNSGITKVKETEDSFDFYGASGSCYSCLKGAYGKGTSFHQGVLQNIINQATKLGVTVTVMDGDTDWSKLFN